MSPRQLRCPRCRQTMDVVTLPETQLEVDVCPGCQGTWYDDGELARHLGSKYRYQSVLANMAPGPSRLICPVCSDRMTLLEFAARGLRLEIDHCTKCRGFWLDKGELEDLSGVAAGGRAPARVVPVAGLTPVTAPSSGSAPKSGGGLGTASGAAIGAAIGAAVGGAPDAATGADAGGPRGPGVVPGGGGGGPRVGMNRVMPSGLRPRPIPARHNVGRVGMLAGDAKGGPGAAQVHEGSALAHYRSFDQERVADCQQITAGLYAFCLISNLPVEVFNPTRTIPWELVGLIAFNVVMFVLEWGMPAQQQRAFILAMGHVPAHTFTIHGLFTLVAASFVHAGWFHLIGNMYFLWTFGDNVCDVLDDASEGRGPWVFIAFYLIVVALANLAHTLVCVGDPQAWQMVVVGASGGVSGVMAAYLRLFPRTRLYQIFFFVTFKMPISFYIVLWIGSNVLMALHSGAASSVAWGAHLGGFLAGFLLIPYFLPFPIDEMRRPRYLLG